MCLFLLSQPFSPITACSCVRIVFAGRRAVRGPMFFPGMELIDIVANVAFYMTISFFLTGV